VLLLLAALLLPVQAGTGAAPETAPDSVWLKGGKIWTGTLLRAGADGIELLDEKGTLRTAERTKIKAMSGPRADYAEFRRRLQQAYSDRSSADEAFAFAGWCGAHGYLRDERLALWRALALDELHEGAHRALGHEARGELWLAALDDGRLATWPDLLRLRATPEQPWRFTTMHFAIEVSGPLDRAVIAAAAAEFFYGEIYALLQSRARLWDLRRPIAVRIWPSRTRGYPQTDARHAGHWDPIGRTLHTWLEAMEGGVARPMHYERLLADAVLRCAAEERMQSPPEVPAWLVVGTSLLLEAGAQWGSGLPTCDPRLPAQIWVQRHAALTAPRTAAALAVVAEAEFFGPRAQDLLAQSYTLLQFLLFPEGETFDEEFDAFLTLALRNRGGGSAFGASFGRRLAALEQAWPERVQRLGRPSPGTRE
jgi:hypothetical protein